MTEVKLYDVVEVNIASKTVSMMTDEPKSERSAEAIERMALFRRANGNNFFAIVEAGKYKDGDIYSPEDD